jgi:hypothetical protein
MPETPSQSQYGSKQRVLTKFTLKDDGVQRAHCKGMATGKAALEPHTLLSQADCALCRAKDDGRDQVQSICSFEGVLEVWQ